MAKTMTVKANGSTTSLLTSEFDDNETVTITPSGVIGGTGSMVALKRCGTGYLRFSGSITTDWAANDQKQVCQLPESMWPAINFNNHVQDGRWLASLDTSGKVYLTPPQTVKAGTSVIFMISYPLKVVGGGVKTNLKRISEKAVYAWRSLWR